MSEKKKKHVEYLCAANVRRCQLRVWPNYKGLGIHLTERSAPPQLITLVESNSPAAAAGLKFFDALLKINRTTVANLDYEEVLAVLKDAIDGQDRVELLVIERKFLPAIIKNRIIKVSAVQNIDAPAVMPKEYLDVSKRALRTCYIHLSTHEKNFGFESVSGENCSGAYVQEVASGSPASRAGLRKCDRILEINDQSVNELHTRIIFKKLNEALEQRRVKLLVADTQTYALGVSDGAGKRCLRFFATDSKSTSSRHSPKGSYSS